MQHGTAREYVVDLLENAQAISTQAEVRSAIQRALYALEGGDGIDEPGEYGPDYGFPKVTEAEKAEAYTVAGAFEILREEAPGNGS